MLIFYLALYYVTFQSRCWNISLKFHFVLAHKKLKKNTPKSCILLAVWSSFPFYKFFYPTISVRISGFSIDTLMIKHYLLKYWKLEFRKWEKETQKIQHFVMYELFSGYLSIKTLIVYFLSEIFYLGNVH